MNTNQVHIKAFLTNFEIACEGSIIALFADLIWLVHDIIYNSFSIWYAFVFIGIVSGIVLTTFALVRHHKYYTKKVFHKQQEICYKKIRVLLNRDFC